MERQRLSVRKRVGIWGSVYIIGGTEADGELLPAEQADELIARFDHEQSLFGTGKGDTVSLGTKVAVPTHAIKSRTDFQHNTSEVIEHAVSL
jgi:hypothetical protein